MSSVTVTFGPNKQMTKLECSSAKKLEIEQADNGGPESCYRISINIDCKKEEAIELKRDYDLDDSWENPIFEHVRQPKNFL